MQDLMQNHSFLEIKLSPTESVFRLHVSLVREFNAACLELPAGEQAVKIKTSPVIWVQLMAVIYLPAHLQEAIFSGEMMQFLAYWNEMEH